MKRARIITDDTSGIPLQVTVTDDHILLADSGETFSADAVHWLPPVANPGTLFALGLNYADHASELAFKAPGEPLVFIKGANTLAGHKANACRPDNIEFMHYECELAVVIGREAKAVCREDALGFVAGYTICNDFAIRDYLENYYRPNLRVKSRDGLCPMGPWLVERDDIPDIDCLDLITRVNGDITQRGNTRDMIFKVPELIEYLSDIMTLSPGDIIATGTPMGVVDMQPGDVVQCEIESIGTLETYIVSEQDYYQARY